MAKFCSSPSPCLSLRIAGYGVVLFTLMSAAMHIFCGFMLIKSPLNDYFYYQNLALNAPMSTRVSSSSSVAAAAPSVTANGTDEFGANILYQHIVLTQRLIGSTGGSGSETGGRHGIWHYLLPLSGHVDDQLVYSIGSGTAAQTSTTVNLQNATAISTPTESTTDNISPVLSRAFFYYYSIAGCFIAVGLLTLAAADCLIVGLVGRTAAPLSIWTVLYAFNIILRILFVTYLAWRAYMFYNHEINYVEKIEYLTSAYSSPAPPQPSPATKLPMTTIRWLAHPPAPTTISSPLVLRGKKTKRSFTFSGSYRRLEQRQQYIANNISPTLSSSLTSLSNFLEFKTTKSPPSTSSTFLAARARRYTPPIIEPALRRMRTELLDANNNHNENFIRYRIYKYGEEDEHDERSRDDSIADRKHVASDNVSSITIIPFVFQPESESPSPTFTTTPSPQEAQSFTSVTHAVLAEPVTTTTDDVYPLATRSATTGTWLSHNTALLRRGNNILDSPFLFIFVILLVSCMVVDVWCLIIVLRLRQTVAFGSEYSPFSNASHEAAAAKAAAAETTRRRRRAQAAARAVAPNRVAVATTMQRAQPQNRQSNKNSVGRALRVFSGSVRASMGSEADSSGGGILSRFFNARESSSTTTGGGTTGAGGPSITGGGLGTNEASSSSTNNTNAAAGATPSMLHRQPYAHQQQSSSLRVGSNNLEVVSVNNSTNNSNYIEMETSSLVSIPGVQTVNNKQVSFAEDDEAENSPKRKQVSKKTPPTSPPTIASALAFAMSAPAAMLAVVSNPTTEEVVLFSAPAATPNKVQLSPPQKRQLTMATSTSDLAALLRDEEVDESKSSTTKPKTSLQVNPIQYQPPPKPADVWLKPSPSTSKPPPVLTRTSRLADNDFLVEEEETSFLCSSPPTMLRYHSPTAAGQRARQNKQQQQQAQQKSSSHAISSPPPPLSVPTQHAATVTAAHTQPRRHEIEVVYVPNVKDTMSTSTHAAATASVHDQQQRHGNTISACDKFAFEVEL